MKLGIFAKTFARPDLESVMDAVAEHGLTAAQFNMACAGLSSNPDTIPPALAERIGSVSRERGVELVAVSGTYNMIHPDITVRQDGLRRLHVLASACERMGTATITLCTGTRDPHNKWRAHPNNNTPEAWADLRTELEKALKMAEAHGVTLCVEPELSNVVNSAAKARRLLDEMQSPRLKVVIDGVNLLRNDDLDKQRSVIDEAFDLLAADMRFAHAKDRTLAGHGTAVGGELGVLDVAYYLGRLRDAGFDGALVMHGMEESQVEVSVKNLKQIAETL